MIMNTQNGIEQTEDNEMDFSPDLVQTTMISNAKRSVRHVETLRCLEQFLLEWGYKSTYETLVKETGVVLEDQSVAKLRESVLEGNWDMAEEAVQHLSPQVASTDDVQEMLFRILEQRFLEAMEENNYVIALQLLRQRLTPMNRNRYRVHQLASCLMYSDIEELKRMAEWAGKNGGSRELLVAKLQGFMPAQVMLPPHRLEALFDMALEFQLEHCKYHNSSTMTEGGKSLLQTHNCGKKCFPTHVIQVIHQRSTELWMCQFSPNGLLLATGGKDSVVDLWTVLPECANVVHRAELCCSYQIHFIVWSPDSSKLAVCCGDESNSVLVYNMPSCILLCTIRVHEDEIYCSAAFFMNSRRLAFGSAKGVFYIADTEDHGKILSSVEGYRVHGMASLPSADEDGADQLLVADSHNRVRLYRFSHQPSTNPSDAQSEAGQPMETTTTTSVSSAAVAAAPTGNIQLPQPQQTTSAVIQSTVATQALSAASFTQVHGLFAPAAIIAGTSMIPVNPYALAAQQAVSVQATDVPGLVATHAQFQQVSGTWTQPTTAVGSQTIGSRGQISTGVTAQLVAQRPLASGSDSNLIANVASVPQTHQLLPATAHGTPAVAGSEAASSMSDTSEMIANVGISNNPNDLGRNTVYCLKTHTTLFKEDAPIQSIVLSKSGEKLLMTVQKMGMRQWDLKSNQVMQRYIGIVQDRYKLHPTFGGIADNFVACGSESGSIYLYNSKLQRPIEVIHTRGVANFSHERTNTNTASSSCTINCVHWNPVVHHMIACVNDLGQLIIIGPESYISTKP